MKFRITLWILLAFFTASMLYAAESLILQKNIADKTVRLHVVANSDSKEDQEQKLVVRDAVLRQVSLLTADCQSAEEAKAVIGENLSAIEEAARSACNEDISVYLRTEDFETRYYDTFTLPAGEYPSLRVNIGQAKGKNWWCVVFPSLCVSATAESVEEAAVTGGFSREEAQLITGGEREYQIRFKTLQWLQDFADWLS